MSEILATIPDRISWSTGMLALLAIVILVAEISRIVWQFRLGWHANADASFSERLICCCARALSIRDVIGSLPYVALCAGAIYFEVHADLGAALSSKIGLPKDWDSFYWIAVFPMADWFDWWRPFVWSPSSSGSIWMRLKLAVATHCNKLQILHDLLIVSLAINVFCLWQISVWFPVVFWFVFVRPRIFSAKEPPIASVRVSEMPHPQSMQS